ncbi:MAG: DNRLRE domain-containing protein [Myxococcales bacterium]|nr:DNRLRE domain-containing protein [Myxococcales bacterium]
MSIARVRPFVSALALALAVGVVAPAAHAQLDPQRVAVQRNVLGLYQLVFGSWGWERVLVGKVWTEDVAAGASVQHWLVDDDRYDPGSPYEIEPIAAGASSLLDFLAGEIIPCIRVFSLTSEERVCDPRPTCVTLGRDGADDALLRADAPTRSYGASQSLTVSAGASGVRNALLRFDLAPIPPGATVVSAELTLTPLLYAGAASVHAALAPWSEATVTWASFAASGAPLGAGPAGPWLPAVEATVPAVAAGAPATVSVRGLVQSWVDGSIPNDGVLLTHAGSDGDVVVYASSEAASAAQRPRLEVCYAACRLDDCGGCDRGTFCVGGLCRAPDDGPVCY